MLGFGYLGEVGILQNHGKCNWIFIFGGLYGFMFKKYLMNKSGNIINNRNNNLLFFSFLILWAFYGAFYQLGKKQKILDIMF